MVLPLLDCTMLGKSLFYEIERRSRIFIPLAQAFIAPCSKDTLPRKIFVVMNKTGQNIKS